MTRIVVDASAVVDFLRATDKGHQVAPWLVAGDVHTPEMCTLEVTSALRGLVLGGKLDASDAEVGLDDLHALAAERHPAEPLLERVWELRDNLTVYDAVYVALAEGLEATLVTTDAKFDTPTVRRLIPVEVIA